MPGLEVKSMQEGNSPKESLFTKDTEAIKDLEESVIIPSKFQTLAKGEQSPEALERIRSVAKEGSGGQIQNNEEEAKAELNNEDALNQSFDVESPRKEAADLDAL